MALHEVIDQGDKFLTPINSRVTKFEVVPFQGGTKAAMGIDPATNRHSMAWISWPKGLYSAEELANSPQVTKIKANCPVCDLADYLKNNTTKPAVAPAPVPPARTEEFSDYEVVDDRPKNIPVSVGDILPPKYVTFGADLIKKAVCTRLGDLTGTVLMAALADLASGYASDPGHKQACRMMSNSMIDGINLCPDDKDELKKYTKMFFEAYQDEGSLINAVKKSMFKSSAEMLEDTGIEVKRKTTNTSIRIGKMAPGHLVD